MTTRGFIGAGDVYIARQVAGVFGALVGPYESSKFEIKPNVDVKKLTSKGKTTYGQVLATVALNQPADFEIDLSEVNKESLTIALLGTQSVLTQTAGTFAAIDTTAVLDSWVELPHKNLGDGATLTDVGAATTYVEGTDYLLNRTMGMYKALSTGAITAAEPLKFTGPYGVIGGIQIAGGTNAQVRARFLFDGQNLVDGSPCQVEIFSGVVAADAALDFLSDNFASVPLKGSMETPVGQTAPFVVKLPT